MRTAIVIPARYRSTRLPGKPLLRVTGKYLIQHVYEQARQSRCADEIVIATDDPRIMAASRHFGGRAMMTRADHPSGTDRIAEVARQLDVDVIINLQGDEPLIDPDALDRLPDLLQDNPTAHIATLATPIRSTEVYRDPNCVKVVCNDQGRALYFSRSPIPMVRDGQPQFDQHTSMFLLHLGLYAYRREVLLELASRPPSRLEQTEQLEQLRVLSLGWTIQVGVIEEASAGVDTWEDYKRFVAEYRQRSATIAQAA